MLRNTTINVVIAFSNLLQALGIKKLLEGEQDIDVISVLNVGTGCQEKIRQLKPEIVLVDFLTLYNGFKGFKTKGKTKFILFDTTCGKENINSAIVTKGIKGVLPVNATLPSLKKAIRAVALRDE
jgi:DNA-binding NarL/FixJ family response regulator